MTLLEAVQGWVAINVIILGLTLLALVAVGPAWDDIKRVGRWVRAKVRRPPLDEVTAEDVRVVSDRVLARMEEDPTIQAVREREARRRRRQREREWAALHGLRVVDDVAPEHRAICYGWANLIIAAVGGTVGPKA